MLIAVQPSVAKDKRGFLLESYKESEFLRGGINTRFVQDNISFSTKDVIRGLHYQLNPHAQSKLVSVASGEIMDVAVDVRRGSPTYGKWASRRLSSENHEMLFVPRGFAHGFCVLSESALVTYRVDHEYAAGAERGVRWNDPFLAIDWPIRNPIVSQKDAELPFLNNAEKNFNFGRDS